MIDGGIVLDAATGRGEFINTIKSSFRTYEQVIGVDSSEKCVSYAEKLFPENNIEIYRMDLSSLAFDDEHFDTITIANSIHHLADPIAIFGELKRVLKKKGYL
jgi:ubiquinone/menaquinone biosynthesis C-methylase UbiE